MSREVNLNFKKWNFRNKFQDSRQLFEVQKIYFAKSSKSKLIQSKCRQLVVLT